MASIGGFFVVCAEKNTPTALGRSGRWGQRLNDYKLAQDSSNGPDPISDYDGGGREEDKSLPSVKKLLLSVRGAQKL